MATPAAWNISEPAAIKMLENQENEQTNLLKPGSLETFPAKSQPCHRSLEN